MLTGLMKQYEPGAAAGGAEGAGDGAAGGAPANDGGAGQPPAGAGSQDIAGQPGGQPPEGAAPEDPEHDVTIGGQTQRVKLSELTAGYSRHADYTQKTQALADRQRDMEADYQQRYARLEALKRQTNGGEPQPGEGEGAPDPNQRISDIEAKLADDKLDRTLKELQGDFPVLKDKMNEDLFCLHASQKGIEKFEDLKALAQEFTKTIDTSHSSRLEAALKDVNNPTVKAAREAWIAEYLKSKGGVPASLGGGGGGPTPKPGAPVKKFDGWDNADTAAKAALGAAHQ